MTAFIPKLISAKLQLFADAGTAGGAAASAGAAAEAASAGTETSAEIGRPQVSEGTGTNTSTSTGKTISSQPQTPSGTKTGENTARSGSDAGSAAAKGSKSSDDKVTEDKKAAFEALISGEYKDEFTARTQEIINRRFRDAKAMKETLDSQSPLIDSLMKKYGVGDIEALREALDGENKPQKEKLPREEMSAEARRLYQKLKAEDAANAAAKARADGMLKANNKLSEWQKDAEAIKRKYPSFDLPSEAKNSSFLSMLKAGVPLGHAYQAIHLDDVVAGAKAQTAKAVTDNVRARGARPIENGIRSTPGVIVRNDVSRLSRADRAEIARQAALGKKIRF